jgi:AcrR family transcriptional regulator
MARKTKRDWFKAATLILANTGSSGLTIEALTSSLGVTKGSFYHHFGSFEQFKLAFLTYFKDEGTLNIITEAEKGAAPDEKLKRLMSIIVREISSMPVNTEVGIRNWALQDNAVSAVMEEVDERRIRYVKQLCVGIVGNEMQAQKMAEMMYVILVGSEHVIPAISQTRLDVLFDEFLRLYQI